MSPRTYIIAAIMLVTGTAVIGARAQQQEPSYTTTLSIPALNAMQDALGRQTCTVFDAANSRCAPLNAFMEMDAQIKLQNQNAAANQQALAEKAIRDKVSAEAKARVDAEAKAKAAADEKKDP